MFNALVDILSEFYWVEETEVPGENHRPAAIYLQILLHNVVSGTPRHERHSNSQLQWSYVLIAQVVVNPTTIQYDHEGPHNRKDLIFFY